jgi:hypothetical protein
VSPREAGECEEVFTGVVEHDRDLRVRPLEYLGDLVELAAEVFPVPVGEADGGPFGVSVIARAFEDQVALDIAAILVDAQGNPAPYPSDGIPVVLFGAHMRGLPHRAAGSDRDPVARQGHRHLELPHQQHESAHEQHRTREQHLQEHAGHWEPGRDGDRCGRLRRSRDHAGQLDSRGCGVRYNNDGKF